ncbi:endonuclease MutS2 [Marivirga tractuosa]|uniref:Endonuclease MutS2 n=1 Tax=Marivirga tractuosa (strain ATCC 23168 / DSM 4126 / NBRC 15989 / NCIMB 1408 / VKM B-1430 / H-43) TaxID=643867 RepID=E4TNF4_MARTH|nr:endonuclease MutS2 [Marivirga tractuosa]ADR20411.1 MutS2 family protein [Marivirga tractuosa DSM 4126]BDD15144.1 endonuclease MutS2 [Marivirga tractuosa]
MILPLDFEQRIGFDKVRDLISAECSSNLGQEIVEKMGYIRKFDKLEPLLLQTDEFLKIFHSGEYFPSGNFIDVSHFIKRAKVNGAFLTEEEFFDLKLSLKTILDCISFFDEFEEEYPYLFNLRKAVNLEPDLYKAIDAKIDERGSLRNNASSALQQIRSDIFRAQAQLRRQVEKIYKQASANKYTPEDASITVRDGRIVIPVLAEYKRRVKGFIHDQSGTGQTVYIEPTEALELNNEVRELQYAERREIVKILTQLTALVKPELENLEKAYKFLAIVDFIRAKARFAQKIGAVFPQLENSRIIEFRNAEHPLLKLSLAEQNKKVIPLSIQLKGDKRILIISGPNAGGKSVALKTVGLLQFMLQCGLLIPVHPDSKCGIFANLFIDIGDQQSIENDLSTYSSHLQNMKNFLLNSNKQTLFLIDEFGTGTEPRFGGAIAESILEELYSQKAFGVITTHYDNIKNFAVKNQNVINGAMKFDERNLEPLYELEIGKPGSSFAIEVAEKMGIPPTILNKAKGKIGTERVNYDKLLNQLGKEKRELEAKIKEIQKREEHLEKSAQDYDELNEFLKTQKKQIITEAKQEAKSIIKEANKRVEQAIREIKESQAEKERTKKARKQLSDYDQKMEPLVENKPAKSSKPVFKTAEGEIKVGDYVKIKGQDTIGEVLSLGQKEAEIMLGELKSKIKLNRLERMSKTAIKKEKKKSFSGTSTGMIERSTNFKHQIDVRGMRAEEAIQAVDRFIDDAMVLGYNEVSILHGRGDGILRKFIRDYLKQYNYVKSLKNEHEERGGDGITLVGLS